MKPEIRETVGFLPNSPGVYIMKNSDAEIIYVGKAINLKKRVSSYFTRNKDIKTETLVRHIATIEHIATRNEYEALVLENNLIKQWRPKYNINLKDGKTYPVIKITNEKFPRIFRTRRVQQDNAEYFGPYPQIEVIDRYLELVDKYYHLRKCRGVLKKRTSPCMYFHIGRCKAPCVGKISADEYQQEINEIRALLTGKQGNLVREFREKMNDASLKLDFETAAWYRDLVNAVSGLQTKQEVQDFNQTGRDYVAWYHEDRFCVFTVFQMRDGKLLGREMYRSRAYSNMDELLLDFFIQYYDKARGLPEIIYICEDFGSGLLETFFSEEYNRKIKLAVPQIGKHKSIMKMVQQNAVNEVKKQIKKAENVPGMEELQKVLGLAVLPRRIEGFDIAQLHGKYPVASLVSFQNGNPDKKNYRRFHIKSLDGQIDDFEAVREAVARRYTRVLNENLERPDLVLIDGGKGQVNAAKGILDAIGLGDIPVAGLAKKNEEIFLPHKSDPILLPDSSEGLKILQNVRDETHRFATTFNQKLREKDGKLSFLQEIPGIGPVRSRKLMQRYGSLQKILESKAEDIARILAADDELGIMVKEQIEEYLGSSESTD
ncbi:MAG: excinuclease ABC subunit UvrC [Spirochaetales bacterium]|nr:excinuclease ABC subunit UvrC [Spirochaetales bacterium]